MQHDLLEVANACIVPGPSKKRYASLHTKLGTDNMAHVYIMLCILDGMQTRLQIANRRQREFRDKEYIALENLGYITHTETRAKAERYYTITPAGKEQAEFWHTIMHELMVKMNRLRIDSRKNLP